MKLTSKDQDDILEVLRVRFKENMSRHQDLDWNPLENKLKNHPNKLWSLNEMEKTGGEPDVIDSEDGVYIFFDCSPESPKGRRSACYDREALESRKQHPPKHNALDLAKQMGIKMLTETEYRKLQKVGDFDTKTSSWLLTPADIRNLGGAIFGDFRYNQVFIYHNGADSYYAARGFRGSLRV
ncbi:MAG: hypothetical protein DHS20C17_30490 [Cyclobacteriaceae bacterium]|nr:MAG: hypothetical protein DHS20C17_30490 [Cyclobacteriaceae bacterium]